MNTIFHMHESASGSWWLGFNSGLICAFIPRWGIKEQQQLSEGGSSCGHNLKTPKNWTETLKFHKALVKSCHIGLCLTCQSKSQVTPLLSKYIVSTEVE